LQILNNFEWFYSFLHLSVQNPLTALSQIVYNGYRVLQRCGLLGTGSWWEFGHSNDFRNEYIAESLKRSNLYTW